MRQEIRELEKIRFVRAGPRGEIQIQSEKWISASEVQVTRLAARTLKIAQGALLMSGRNWMESEGGNGCGTAFSLCSKGKGRSG